MTFRLLLSATVLGGLLVLALPPAPAHASVCYVGNALTPGTEVQVEMNGQMYAPGKIIDNCAGTARAHGGALQFCRLNKLGQFACKPLEVGQRDEVEGMVAKPMWASVMQVLKDFVNPEPRHEMGMKRLRDTNAPLEGLPEGAVLMPPGGLEFSAPRAGLEGIDRLTVAVKDGPGTPLFTSGAPAPRVAVPHDVLQPGGAYRWKLTDGGETLAGGFTVAEAEDQQDFEAELAGLLEGSGPDPSTRNLVRAVLAKQYGYTYDMFLALEAARDSASMAEPKAVYGARPDGETMP